MSRSREELESFVIQIITSAGEMAISGLKKDFGVKYKKGLDIVTDIDLLIEEFIINQIKCRYPHDKVIAEESSNNFLLQDDVYTWIVDPIDGTANYSTGNPNWSISIALIYNKEIICGFVYLPIYKELYSAVYDSKSKMNSQEINVSNKTDMREVLISCMLTTKMSEADSKEISRYIFEFNKVSRGTRVTCSGALELCWLAKGIFGASIILTSGFISCPAGIKIIKNAGGLVTDRMCNQYVIGESKSIIAANNSLIHKQIMNNLEKFSQGNILSW